jgi:hypothetical protein
LIKLSELSKFNALMHVMCWLKELEWRFLDHELMKALGITYP